MSSVVSVVIPAHNEARVIARTLSCLRSDGEATDLEVVVVCNGCTDDTAEVARTADPRARVIEIEPPSKAEAMRVGNRAARAFPRVHLDADVELTGRDVRALVAPLDSGDVLATAPRRALDRGGAPWPVRWYYDVWEQLPQVRAGLFGRGAIALSEEGQRRVDALPPLMSDDLGTSEVFGATERRVVDDAQVRVVLPRTVADLLRRRVRVATGTAQADLLGARGVASATTPSVLVTLLRSRPLLTPRVAVFLAVTAVARLRSRRAVRAGEFTTWLRDESSRA